MADTTFLSQDISNTLAEITARLRQGNVSDALKGTLIANQAELQAMYDKLLTRGGLLTADEKLKLEEDLRTAKRNSLEASAASMKRKLLIALGVGVVITVVAIWVYQKGKP